MTCYFVNVVCCLKRALNAPWSCLLVLCSRGRLHSTAKFVEYVHAFCTFSAFSHVPGCFHLVVFPVTQYSLEIGTWMDDLIKTGDIVDGREL